MTPNCLHAKSLMIVSRSVSPRISILIRAVVLKLWYAYH